MHAVWKRKLKFQVLSFNSSDRCRGTIVYTKYFELNACVLCFIKRQKRSPFFLVPTDIYFMRFHTFQNPVFRPSYGMNKTIPDVSGPCRSLVQIWLYSMHILIWSLNKFCRFLSLLMLCNDPYFTLLFKWPVLFLKHVWISKSLSSGLNRGISLCVSILARAYVYFSVLSSFDHIWGLF